MFLLITIISGLISLVSIPLWKKMLGDYDFKYPVVAVTCTVISMIAGFYSILSFFSLIFNTSLEEDMRTYKKGVIASYILSDTTGNINLTYEDVNSYTKDIIDANNLVYESRKYRNNWYLKDFYYDEVAELPYIEKNN